MSILYDLISHFIFLRNDTMSIPMHPATLRRSVSVGEQPHCCWASYSTSYPRFVRPIKMRSLSQVRVALFTCEILDLYASSDSSSSLISFSSAMYHSLFIKMEMPFPTILSFELFLQVFPGLAFLPRFHFEDV